MSVFKLNIGTSPIIISIPHDGERIPNNIKLKMHDYAHKTPDRDRLISKIFDFHKTENVTRIKSNISRYVIDLNRPVDQKTLYPGQSETELCPTTLFDNRSIYQKSQQPDEKEINERIKHYWQPYHQELRKQIERIQKTHGHCILIDAHSIAPQVPRFFEGTLPDINIGTNNSNSCSISMEKQIEGTLKRQSSFSYVINGRFKGGYITRNYGQPEKQQHAIQFEISQSTYLDSEKFAARGNQLRILIHEIIRNLV